MIGAKNDSRQAEIVVGYESHNYGGERNTYAPIDGVRHVKLRRIPFEFVPTREHLGLHRVFAPLFQNPQVDLVHLWNRVSVGQRPWGLSFEDVVPYLNPKLHRRAIALQRRRLHSDSCRFIIGMSDFAVNRFRDSLSDGEWMSLKHKVHRVYPHHAARFVEANRSSTCHQEPLRLIFVGRDFFRKGGLAALQAVERSGEALDLELSVVSTVDGGDYRGIPPTDVDVDKVRERLSDNERVRWVKQLSHSEVMTEIQRSHIGLLPTLSDTFGYSVVEFMSLGVPSIVSDVQALPEITGTEAGWSVHIDSKGTGDWLGALDGLSDRRTEFHRASEACTQGIINILQEVREDPSLLEDKSTSARSRFLEMFSDSRRTEALLSIYSQAMS